ncbi:MAG: ABC transporter permease [Bacillota bacterium]
MNVASSTNHAARLVKRRTLWKTMYQQRCLMMMSIPFLIWIFIFEFGPMFGWLMAFVQYDPNKGILGSQWAGLRYFKMFFEDPDIWLILRNTVMISFLYILSSNVFPLILALMISEVGDGYFKRALQTVTYLPHFVSFVVVANIFLTLFGMRGPVNELLRGLGWTDRPVLFWQDKNIFWYMVTFVRSWKEIGWGAIIYLAAIASVDQEMYEAAKIDGCGRFRAMWHITIPSILPTITLLWVLNMAGIFNAGFDASYLLGNAMTREASQVIDTYVYELGISMGMYSFSTAVNLLQTAVGFAFVFITNTIARKLTDYSLW